MFQLQYHLLLSTSTGANMRSDDEFIGVCALAQGISAKMDATEDSSVNLQMFVGRLMYWFLSISLPVFCLRLSCVEVDPKKDLMVDMSSFPPTSADTMML